MNAIQPAGTAGWNDKEATGILPPDSNGYEMALRENIVM
jgi:hypothetical protein